MLTNHLFASQFTVIIRHKQFAFQSLPMNKLEIAKFLFFEVPECRVEKINNSARIFPLIVISIYDDRKFQIPVNKN